MLFEPGDADELARVLLDLAGDAPRRQAMSEAAARKAPRFAWPDVTQRVLEAYVDAISAHPGSPRCARAPCGWACAALTRPAGARRSGACRASSASDAIGAWVYILRCADGTLYTGWTVDVERRLAAHGAGTASRYTRSRLPVELVGEHAGNGRARGPARGGAHQAALACGQARADRHSSVILTRAGETCATLRGATAARAAPPPGITPAPQTVWGAGSPGAAAT